MSAALWFQTQLFSGTTQGLQGLVCGYKQVREHLQAATQYQLLLAGWILKPCLAFKDHS